MKDREEKDRQEREPPGDRDKGESAAKTPEQRIAAIEGYLAASRKSIW